MRDKDRADKLAKAIEEMVEGRTPEALDDEELEELLQIAKIRLDAAQTAAQSGGATQRAVFERLMTRLNELKEQGKEEPNSPTSVTNSAEAAPIADRPTEDGHVKDVIGLRRRVAEHAIAISETHREAVWQRVQARIQAQQSEKRGLLRWPLRRRDREAEDLGAALDRMVLGEPIWEAEDSELGELLNVARIRRAAAGATDPGFADRHARVWARLRPRLLARLKGPRQSGAFKPDRPAVPWAKLAAAGAVVALAFAALGPIPATGLANHPVADFARFVGGHVGVTETSAPPAVPPVTVVIESNDASADEASNLMGRSVYEPAFVPSDYHEVSSQYFPTAVTADQGGLFVLAYEEPSATGNPETILIYQEAASSNNIVVEQGFAQDIQLPDTGIAATYVNGTWRSVGSDLTWSDADGQSLLFDLGGLRTTIHTTDGDLAVASLVAIADSLAAQVAPPIN